MNKVDKAWWKFETKKYKFSPTKCRKNGENEYILKNATAFRIVPVLTPGGAGWYVIEGNVDGTWKFLKGTNVHYSRPEFLWYRNYENAYNRCKKLARKFSEIKMKTLVYESALASYMYGSNEPKMVEAKDIFGLW